MIDPGELVSETLRREFGEEAMNSLEADSKQKERLKTQVSELFRHGSEVILTLSPHPFLYKLYFARIGGKSTLI